MRFVNDRRPWFGTLHGPPMSIAELVDNGTLAPEAAAVLEWAMARGASVFVAAGPPGGGKSILATALLEYLPENAQVYVTCGVWDRLEIPHATGGPSYLLINELSWHMPLYLSGEAAKRAFLLLGRGVRMLGTLHARSAAEAVDVLCDEAEVTRADLVAPFVIVALSARWVGGRVVRRVIQVGFLPPSSGPLDVVYEDHQPARLRVEALASWSGLSVSEVQAEIRARAAQ